MKKTIYSVLVALTLSFMSTAQNPSAVSKMPYDANGYLILNKSFYENVSSWRVIVRERIVNGSKNNIITKLDQTLTEKNYLKIPDAYRTASHTIEITGYAGPTTVVHVNEMPIEPPVETMCTWICNGPNYAYGLQMNNIPSQGIVRISMQSPPPPSDAPYYYQWFSPAGFNSLIQNQNLAANYGYSSWAWAIANATDDIIHINVPPGQYKYDQFGSPMNGNVYGVAKYFGPYTQHLPYIHSNGLTVMESDCSQPIIWALNLVNAGDETPVNVVCNGTSSNTAATEVPYAEVPDPTAADNDPCFEDYYDYIGWTPASGTGVYQLIQIPCNWLNTSPDPGTGTGIHWPEHVSRISMKRLYGSGDPISVVLENGNLFNEQGDFVGPNYTIPAGFYNIIYQYDDLSIGSYFVEVATTTGSAVQEKDFLSYTAYPVPIVDNNFRIDFNASKKVEFTYELRDANNNLLFTDHYTVEKDQQVTKLIQPAVTIQDGMLYNRFIFSDNSIINFTTVK